MKTFFKSKLILTLFILTAVIANAEESNYSRILSQNQKITSTFTGDIEGNWRMLTNYETIHTASFTSQYFAFTYDQPFYLFGQKLGIGLHALSEDIGSHFLSIQKIQLAVAYHPVYKGNVFSIASHVGYVNYISDLKDELWPDQYDDATERYSSALSNNELLDGNIRYLDIGVGVKWRKQIEDFKPEIGINILHINSPEVSATNNLVKIDPDIYSTASLRWDVNSKYYAISELIYNSHHADNQFMIGEIVAYVFSDIMYEKSVFAGLFANIDNSQVYSLTPVIGTNYNQFYVALSYDLNFAKANKYTSVRGPFEITISYMDLGSRLKKLALPCRRF